MGGGGDRSGRCGVVVTGERRSTDVGRRICVVGVRGEEETVVGGRDEEKTKADVVSARDNEVARA